MYPIYNLSYNFKISSQGFSQPSSNNKVVQEMLYLDSQMENFKLYCQNFDFEDQYEEDEAIAGKESNSKNDDNITNDQTTEYASAMSGFKEPHSLPNLATSRNVSNTNDLITDDERDPNLSY